MDSAPAFLPFLPTLAAHLLVKHSILHDHVEWLIEVAPQENSQLWHAGQLGLDHNFTQHIRTKYSAWNQTERGAVSS